MKKILASTHSYNRSDVAVLLADNGGFDKVKNIYIHKKMQIMFVNDSNLTEENIAWADYVCGPFKGVKAMEKLRDCDKVRHEGILTVVKQILFGTVDMYQIVDKLSGCTNIDVKHIVVLGNQVDYYKHNMKAFTSEKEAVEYAYNRIINEKAYLESRLKALTKLEKDWARSIKSFG